MRDRAPRTGPAWSIAVATSVLVVGAVVALMGLQLQAAAVDARSAASAQAETQLELVADTEQGLVDLRLEIGRKRDTVEEATTSVEEAESARNATEIRVSAARGELQKTEAEVPERVIEAREFIDAVTPLADIASAHLESERRILDCRSEQVEMGSEGNVREFNRAQNQFNEMADAANVELETLDRLLAALPPLVETGPRLGVGTSRFTVSEVVLDPPTGRAQVQTNAPDLIPCTPQGTEGCRYDWVATFTETNWLDVTIERIAVRYVERGGRAYWFNSSGEWSDVHIIIPASGSATYDSWVRTDSEADSRLIIGGKLKLRWEGRDAEGNSLSGSLTVPLERP